MNGMTNPTMRNTCKAAVFCSVAIAVLNLTGCAQVKNLQASLFDKGASPSAPSSPSSATAGLTNEPLYKPSLDTKLGQSEITDPVKALAAKRPLLEAKASVPVEHRPICWTEEASRRSRQTGVDVVCANTMPFPITMRVRINEQTNIVGAYPQESFHEMAPLTVDWVMKFSAEREGWRLNYNTFPLAGRNKTDTRASIHRLPFPRGTQAFVSQSADGPQTSHSKDVAHAVDFSVPLGTLVVASLDGYVSFVRKGSTESGSTDEFRGKENLVLLHHDDDTQSVYGHLDPDVPVVVGQRVKAGEIIGKTGRSGMMGGPHLHYEQQYRAKDKLHVVNPAFMNGGQVLQVSYGRKIIVE